MCTEITRGKRPWLNPQGSYRSKHIDVRFYFVRGLVGLGQVIIHSLASAEKHADILTRPLGREVFRRHRNFLKSFHEGVN